MNVKELIEKLSQYPEDMDVFFDCNDCYGEVVDLYIDESDKVLVLHDPDLGDSFDFHAI